MAPHEIQLDTYESGFYKYLLSDHADTNKKSEMKIVWRNVILLTVLHIGAMHGLYLCVAQVMWTTFFFGLFNVIFAGLGITAGAHRLWAHKSYKAKFPLRLLLVIMNSTAMQNSAIVWVRDHRMHHKYSETDADPHNSKRGFFFSHMGWLAVRKHPEIKAKRHTLDMNDLWSDPLLRFQYKYFAFLGALFGIAIPSYIPTLWGEKLENAFFVVGILRYVYSLHGTWLVNSAAHIWGMRPYDKTINPAENLLVSIICLGEGFHNYHHTFPWDYKTAELGNYTFNLTTLFIDVMAKIGWAYDLRSVTPDVIENRVKRTGGRSHKTNAHE
ncbi:acyl-CoA Delta(11) desaturase-like [Pararge aegeria]|uniref:Jg17419 protein n=1 Tax=Pararge aegeria aegeria TaxID=348720 RepID=A0A8S4S118_9NEOP|nr:acyl-CoA Delta(11) desaturase-like [Pararge aegeria]CAH2245022.1 jg17419 [Pararge aegeria aegeria]